MATILVADDDRMISHLVCATLRRAGHAAVAAFDTPDALALASRPPRPDVVLLDLQLPSGSGLDVARALRASPETAALPVVILSGTIAPEVRAELERLGIRETLLKPVAPATLLETVARAIGEG